MARSSSPFLSQEEYEDDIYELFSHFNFETPEQRSAERDRHLIDVEVMEFLFEALGKPMSAVDKNKIDKLLTESDPPLPSPSFAIFRDMYLRRFPYDEKRLLNEALDFFDTEKTGAIGLEDLERVVQNGGMTFTRADLSDLVATFGDRGKISRAKIASIEWG
jgi:Ca2+-binding EF-hand superfamily protein